ncbi:hypothetical protein DFQ29_008049 [Apophysomyces sp. BC1021]|nr:hypothetical protein DFQ29_008049 [Apophysomyces sp. BC1021]
MVKLAMSRYMELGLSEDSCYRQAFESHQDALAPELRGALKQASLDSVDMVQKSRLWYNHKVFGSVLKHQQKNRAAYFVRLSVDVDSRREDVLLEKKHFFGKVYFYLQPIQIPEMILAVVGIYNIHVDEQTDSIYYYAKSEDQLFVMDCKNIENFDGSLFEDPVEMNGRSYCIWPGMVSCDESRANNINRKYI